MDIYIFIFILLYNSFVDPYSHQSQRPVTMDLVKVGYSNYCSMSLCNF